MALASKMFVFNKDYVGKVELGFDDWSEHPSIQINSSGP